MVQVTAMDPNDHLLRHPPIWHGIPVDITLLQPKQQKQMRCRSLFQDPESGATVAVGAGQYSSGPGTPVLAMESMENSAQTEEVFQGERHSLAVPDQDACHLPPALMMAGSVTVSLSSSVWMDLACL